MTTTLSERMKSAWDHRKRFPPPYGASRLTRTALAQAVGVKLPSVTGWFNGETKELSGPSAVKASAFLRVNSVWLATGKGSMLPANVELIEDDRSYLTDDERDLLSAYASLTASQRESVLRLVKSMRPRVGRKVTA